MNINYRTCFDCKEDFKEDYKTIFVDIDGVKVNKCFTCFEKTLIALPKSNKNRLELINWMQSVKVNKEVIESGIPREKRYNMHSLLVKKATYYKQIALILTNTINKM